MAEEIDEYTARRLSLRRRKAVARSRSPMRYPALVFDFDGTIANTFDEAIRIYNVLAEDFGYRLVREHEVPELRNFSAKQLFRYLGVPKRKVPFLLARGRTMLRSDIRRLPLVEGIAETLPKLREEADFFGILSSNAVENVEAFLEEHGLDHLFTFISTTPKLSGKAKHMKAIARTFSLHQDDLLYVGDEIRDVKAAHKAGIHVAGVSWGFNSRSSLQSAVPTYLLDHPSELEVVCLEERGGG